MVTTPQMGWSLSVWRCSRTWEGPERLPESCGCCGCWWWWWALVQYSQYRVSVARLAHAFVSVFGSSCVVDFEYYWNCCYYHLGQYSIGSTSSFTSVFYEYIGMLIVATTLQLRSDTLPIVRRVDSLLRQLKIVPVLHFSCVRPSNVKLPEALNPKTIRYRARRSNIIYTFMSNIKCFSLCNFTLSTPQLIVKQTSSWDDNHERRYH